MQRCLLMLPFLDRVPFLHTMLVLDRNNRIVSFKGFQQSCRADSVAGSEAKSHCVHKVSVRAWLVRQPRNDHLIRTCNARFGSGVGHENERMQLVIVTYLFSLYEGLASIPVNWSAFAKSCQFVMTSRSNTAFDRRRQRWCRSFSLRRGSLPKT